MFEWLFGVGKKTALKASASGAPHLAGASTSDAPVPSQRPIDIALRHHQAGRLSEAETAYRQVLAADADNIDALHFSGVIAYQLGRHERAAELISQALSRNASNAPAHNNLGNVLGAQGKPDEAIACYRKALALAPDYVDAHFNLGAALSARGELDEAVACYQSALSLAPEMLMARFNLGNVFAEQGKPEEAIACFQKALALDPEHAEARWIFAMSQLSLAYESEAGPGRCRAEFSSELTKLKQWCDAHRVTDASKVVGAQQPFHLAYQEEDN